MIRSCVCVCVVPWGPCDAAVAASLEQLGPPAVVLGGPLPPLDIWPRLPLCLPGVTPKTPSHRGQHDVLACIAQQHCRSQHFNITHHRAECNITQQHPTAACSVTTQQFNVTAQLGNVSHLVSQHSKTVHIA